VDVETSLAYFQEKQEEDHEFFYTIDADDISAIKHVFWVDGRARRAYLEFGDTTCDWIHLLVVVIIGTPFFGMAP
jgi:hypothetical protein